MKKTFGTIFGTEHEKMFTDQGIKIKALIGRKIKGEDIIDEK